MSPDFTVQPGESRLLAWRPGTASGALILFLVALVVSTAFTLSNGEFKTRAYAGMLSRYNDAAPISWYADNDAYDRTHPVYAEFMKSGYNTLAPRLISGLASVTGDHATAVGIYNLLMRAAAIAVLFLAGYAVTRNYSLSLLLAVGMFFGTVADVYGFEPRTIYAGATSVVCCLAVLSLAVLRRLGPALAVAGFQLFLHPITFVSWSILYAMVFMHFFPGALGRLGRLPMSRLAVLLPPLAGFAVYLCDASGVLPAYDSEFYWALVRVRTYHAVFFGLPLPFYLYPAMYLMELAALVLLARHVSTGPMVGINNAAAAAGAGLFLLYLMPELELSAWLNLFMPLRFEGVMTMILLLNAFALMLNEKLSIPSRLVGMAFMVAVWVDTTVTLAAWILPLGIVWREKMLPVRRAVGIAAALVAATLVMAVLYAPPGAFARAGTAEFLLGKSWPFLAIMAGLASPFLALVPVSVVGAFQVPLHAGFVWLYAAAAAIAGFGFVPKDSAKRMFMPFCLVFFLVACWNAASGHLSLTGMVIEGSAIAGGEVRRTELAQAVDWIRDNVPEDKPILVHPGILLVRAGIPNTTINYDLFGQGMYMPPRAESVGREILDLYGIDIRRLRDGHFRTTLQGLSNHWIATRDGFLRGERGNAYCYCVESSGYIPASKVAESVFENRSLRVYALGGAGCPGAQAQ